MNIACLIRTMGVSAAPASSPALPFVSVLIVDDDDESRELLAAIVRRHGFSAATARDGVEAIELLHTIRPGLILLDLRMPRMDGAHFREIQRRHREWLNIPTIVMTATHDEPVLDVAIEQTLKKPTSADEVIRLLRSHAGQPAES